VCLKTIAPLLTAAALLASAAPGRAGPLQDGYKAYHQGRYEESLQHYIRGQLKRPEQPEVLYNVGNAYYKTGDYAAAAAHYRQALEKAPEHLKSRLHYNLGNTAYRLGDLHGAIGSYESALRITPNDVQARENLEFVRKRLQEQEQPSQGGDQSPETMDGDGNTRGDPQPGAEPLPAPEKDRDRTAGEVEDETAVDRSQQEGEDPAGVQPDGDRNENTPGQADRPAPPDPAVHMLNRLKDEPGRAMMPDYGRQPVDKDW
jgi:Ca-activated chloride channel homolog